MRERVDHSESDVLRIPARKQLRKVNESLVRRELTHRDEEDVTLREGASLRELRAAMLTSHRELTGIRGIMVSLNAEFPDHDDVVLQEGDVVALFPPVSGG